MYDEIEYKEKKPSKKKRQRKHKIHNRGMMQRYVEIVGKEQKK